MRLQTTLVHVLLMVVEAMVVEAAVEVEDHLAAAEEEDKS